MKKRYRVIACSNRWEFYEPNKDKYNGYLGYITYSDDTGNSKRNFSKICLREYPKQFN